MTPPILISDHSLITRRSLFIGAAASLLCAPAIVRAANLMPVRRLPFPFGPQYAGYVERLFLHALEGSLQAATRKGRASVEVCGHTVDASRLRRRMDFCRRTFAYTAVTEDLALW
jgi:hypothetical protein